MVKNKNVAQTKARIKGNAKPSNSDRAAEFLQRNTFFGTNVFLEGSPNNEHPSQLPTSFTGDSETKMQFPPVAFSSLLPHDQDPVAATLDVDFLAVLRRLEKRNGATKQKALAALKSLLDDKEAKSEDIITSSVLPFWPRLYNSLACDDDRRVRELAQVAMHCVARRIGRKLGPCLKEVVVSWTFATTDAYKNAAKSALLGLNDIFPSPKLGHLYRSHAKYLLDACERRITFLSMELPNQLKCKKNRCDGDPLTPEIHSHLNATVQFLTWVSILLPELSQLPSESPQKERLYVVLKRIFPTTKAIMDTVNYVPLNAAYYLLVLAMCQAMPQWVAQTDEIFSFVVPLCVMKIDATPERLSAATVCLAAFGERIWREVDWTQLVENTLIPMVGEVQMKTQQQAIFRNLLPLVSQLPFNFAEAASRQLATRLITAVQCSLLSALNLPTTDTDLSKVSVQSHIIDHGLSLECLCALAELTRYLLDRAALDDKGQEMTEYLINNVLLQLVAFGLTYNEKLGPGVRRWVNKEQFISAIFKQICSTVAHLARDKRTQLQIVFVTLRDGITNQLKSSSLHMGSALVFIQQLIESGSTVGEVVIGDSCPAQVEPWCRAWLQSIGNLVRPTWSGVASVDFAKRWLLTLSINGYLGSDSFDQPLDILLSRVLPEFDESMETFIWTDSMSHGLVCCGPLGPVSQSVWSASSETTHRNFVDGPIKGLLLKGDPESSIVCLTSLVEHLIPGGPPSLVLNFTESLLSSQCVAVQEKLVLSLNQTETINHALLSSLVVSFDANGKSDLTGFRQLVDRLAKSTISCLWSSDDASDIECGYGILTYLKSRDPIKSEELCLGIWIDMIDRLKIEACYPHDFIRALNFLRRLPVAKDACALAWFSGLDAIVTQIGRETAVIETVPSFLYPEVFPMDRLPSLARLIVCIQLGFRLRLHTAFTPGSPSHVRLASILLILQSWLVEGVAEPVTLQDISLSSRIFLPTQSEAVPSLKNLISFVNGICSEVSDAVYSLEELDKSADSATLRGALARRLVGVHPLNWPLRIREAASCFPSDSWLQDQVTQCGSEVFSRLCEVCLPVGVLQRCLPRGEIIAYILSLASRDFLDGNKEGLARLLEMVASLSSVAFVGGSYAMTLAPLTLEDPVREALVDVDNMMAADMAQNEPEAFRATLAAMKALHMLILLRQPAELQLLPRSSTGILGLAQMSLFLRQPKPRLTRDQWDSMLCLTANWITQAVARPVPLSSLFPLHAFQLVAAMGALFANSLCARNTVTGFLLLKCDTSQAISVDQLIDLNREEWDETDFDFGDDYDNEDDGTVAEAPDFSVLDKLDHLDDAEDDFADADNEEMRVDDPSAYRRLPPPALIQKDWREFFSGNLYGCLVPLAAELCLSQGDQVNTALKNTPPSVSALCAAVSTCTVDNLLGCLDQQPDIVITYLLEINDKYASNGLPPPHIENNLFYSECMLAPHARNAINLSVRFLVSSPFQAGQLLGHTLLTRLVATRSLEPVRRLSDILIAHIPPSWISALTSPLPETMETILADSDAAIGQWARGSYEVTQLLGGDTESAHQRFLSYLLAWDALVSLLSSASQQSRAGLQAALLQADHVWLQHLLRLLLVVGILLPAQCEINSLLSSPCRLEPDPRLLLLPNSSSLLLQPKGIQKCKDGSSSATTRVFATPNRLVRLPGHRHPSDLSHLALRLLRRLLAESPALMRALYAQLQRGGGSGAVMTSGQARQLGGHLERLVRRHFSVDLIAAEVEAIERRASEFKRRLGTTPYLNGQLPDAGSVDIRGRPVSGEIITTYHFSSDQSLEMVIRLPENFPLSSVSVEAGHKVGAPTSNWRAWLVHLAVFINNQNGSILEGIGLWLRNLKKKFDGVEDCAICYSVIHDKNFSFPRMQCRVCKKRFHNDCMFRYFQTSRNPKCPMCRSLFYAGAN